MKASITFILLLLLITTSVYSLDEETKRHMIELYNLTRSQYILIIDLLDDLSNSKISTNLAEEKINEWKTEYRKKTENPPNEAEKVCDLMNKIIDLTEDIVSDYEPHNQRTKDKLNELEDIKKKFLSEMHELNYILQ